MTGCETLVATGIHETPHADIEVQLAVCAHLRPHLLHQACQRNKEPIAKRRLVHAKNATVDEMVAGLRTARTCVTTLHSSCARS